MSNALSACPVSPASPPPAASRVATTLASARVAEAVSGSSGSPSTGSESRRTAYDSAPPSRRRTSVRYRLGPADEAATKAGRMGALAAVTGPPTPAASQYPAASTGAEAAKAKPASAARTRQSVRGKRPAPPAPGQRLDQRHGRQQQARRGHGDRDDPATH